jgi:hypothetical protein
MALRIPEFQIESDKSFFAGFASAAERSVSDKLLDPAERLIASTMLIENASANAAGNATAKLVDLIHDIPQRMFANDNRAFAQACGFNTDAIDCMLSIPPSTIRFARSDAYLTENGWKFTEFNIGASIGSYHLDWAYRNIEKQTEVERCIRTHGATRLDTAELWTDAVISDAQQLSRKSVPYICIVDTKKHFERHRVWNNSMASAISATGRANASACSVDELSTAGGIALHGRKVDYIYRLFGVDDVMLYPSVYQPILKAINGGELGLGISLDSRIFGNKAALSFLSDPKHRQHYCAAELEMIGQYIPATRMLTEDNFAYAREKRELLVAKPVDGQGGVGVIFGQDFSEHGWKDELLALHNSGVAYVLQEKIAPIPQRAVGWSIQNGLTEHEYNLIFGVFALNSKYAGIGARGVPSSQKIVKYGNVGYMAPAFVH